MISGAPLADPPAYAEYDAAAVALWHEFSEARDFARMYAENHGLHDLASIADAYVYHAGRARRADAPATGGGKPST